MTKTYWIPILCSSSLFVDHPHKHTRKENEKYRRDNTDCKCYPNQFPKIYLPEILVFFPIALAASVVDAVLNPIAGISVIVSA